MRSSCATQASVDYYSERDAVRKIRVASAIAPVLAANADNSPVFEGAENHTPLRQLPQVRHFVRYLTRRQTRPTKTLPRKMPTSSTPSRCSGPTCASSTSSRCAQQNCLPADCAIGYTALVKGIFYSEESLAAIERELGVEGGVWPIRVADLNNAIVSVQTFGMRGKVYGETLES